MIKNFKNFYKGVLASLLAVIIISSTTPAVLPGTYDNLYGVSTCQGPDTNPDEAPSILDDIDDPYFSA